MSAIQGDRSTGTDSPIGLTDLGRVRVLRALAEHEQLSRAELVGRTGLARATVSSIVYELINGNLVRESGAADAPGSRTGRPAQALSLVPDAAYALGLDMAHDHVRTVLTDLVGTVLWDQTRPVAVDGDPERALDTAVRLIDGAIADVHAPREKILGLGAGFACPVDKERRQLHAEGIMPGWVGVQPVEELTRRTGLSTQIINDANAGVLAEQRFGAARGCDNALYLRLSSGIGAGAICDGRMLTGHGGIAGELGHVVVEPHGLLCRCGNRGCLETIASPPAIADLLTRSWGRRIGAAEVPELLRRADRGTARAVADAGEAVGRVLAITVMMLNPEMIVVGGELAAAGETLFEPMLSRINRNTMVCHAESLRIVPSALGDSAGVRGAAALVLERAPEALVLSSAG
ncbi:MAG TPA: ROK family transcriptional regulator [Actinospica sp.]|jgi:predicted NBD/HSP70 family sugar kinase|nr:ROK family transcriptional regulator [Actinospica sp.]